MASNKLTLTLTHDWLDAEIADAQIAATNSKLPAAVRQRYEGVALALKQVRDRWSHTLFDPTNHHNALTCPYCNPDRKLIIQPTNDELAHALQIAAEYGFEACKQVLFSKT